MKLYKAITLISAIFVTIMAKAADYTPSSIPNVHVAQRTHYVSNPDGVLSASCVDSLNHILAQVWKSTTAEPVVVAVDRIAPRYTPAQFATELGQLWGVGKSDKDNGIVVLLVRDDRQMFIATGRGVEGVLPDAACGRIVRNLAIPHFMQGNYNAGMFAAVSAISRVLEDPTTLSEILSTQPNDAIRSPHSDDEDIFSTILYTAAALAAITLLVVLWTLFAYRRSDELTRYKALDAVKPFALFMSFLCLGMALPAYLLCVWRMNRLRNHSRKCPNCQHPMHKLDEATDNQYLTPAQDLEEHLNSIDYDVWLCNNCGECDVIPYVNKSSAFTVCDRCGARAVESVGNRIVRQPTPSRPGMGIRSTRCRNCGNHHDTPYEIQRESSVGATALGAAAAIGSMRGGGFGSGGGFSGGSFGGGSFGGGGGGGSW